MTRLTPIGITVEAFDEVHAATYRYTVEVTEAALVAVTESDVQWLRRKLDETEQPYMWWVHPVTGATHIATDDPVIGTGCAALERGELRAFIELQERSA